MCVGCLTHRTTEDLTKGNAMPLRCAIVLALAGTAAAEPVSESLTFEHFATIAEMGRIDVNPITGEIAVGTTGPGIGAAHAIRVVGTDGSVRSFGGAVPDPDAVAWDVNGVFGPAGSVIVGGVGGLFAAESNGTSSLLFESSSDFDNPETIAFTPEGDLLIADYGNQRVQLLDSQGRFGTVAASDSPVNQVAVSFATGEILYGDQQGIVSDIGVTGRLLSNGESDGPHLTGLAFGDGSALWGDDVYAVDAKSGDLLRFDGEASSVIATGLFSGADQTGLLGAGIDFLPSGAMVVGIPSTDTIWQVVPTPGTGALIALGSIAALRRRR